MSDIFMSARLTGSGWSSRRKERGMMKREPEVFKKLCGCFCFLEFSPTVLYISSCLL